MPATKRLVPLGERFARVGVRHRLADGTTSDDPVEAVRSLVALHATDPATVYLSAAVRCAAPSLDQVADALYDRRVLVRHHAMRRTLWVAEPDVMRDAHAACTAALAQQEWRRLESMLSTNDVVDPQQWIAVARQRALEVVELAGTCTARQLGAEAPELAVPLRMAVGKSYETTQGAHSRLLTNLGFDGALIRTRSAHGWVSGEYLWSLADRWIAGGLADPARSSRHAVAAMVERYLWAFGPVTSLDVAWWGGWGAKVVAQALSDIGAEPVTTDADGLGTPVAAWLHPEDIDPVDAPAGWGSVLPSLDPTLMGWKQRDWMFGEHATFGASVFDRNGNVGNCILADGALVGTWAHRRDGTVAVEYLATVPASRRRLIDHSVERYLTVVGDTVVRPRYPAPLQATLMG